MAPGDGAAKTANVSAAAIYRLSELYHPTFLMDEAQDQLKNQDFWLVIKSGHAPGEYAIRCNPNTNKQLRGYRYIDSRPRHNDLKRIFEQYLPPENEK